MTDEETAQLEVWKVTIDVQKHFNDLSMRVRNFAITVLGALLAAAGYALKDGATVTLFDEQFSLTGWILLAASLLVRILFDGPSLVPSAAEGRREARDIG